MSTFNAIIDSPIGRLGIKTQAGVIEQIGFLSDRVPLLSANDPFTKKIVNLLQHYFVHQKALVYLPLAPQGTAFQKRVWQHLQSIPWGSVQSYGDIATQLKSSARAVGNACRRNPILLFIPCHRVVAKNSLGGFNGATKGKNLEKKLWLLQHEHYLYR